MITDAYAVMFGDEMCLMTFDPDIPDKFLWMWGPGRVDRNQDLDIRCSYNVASRKDMLKRRIPEYIRDVLKDNPFSDEDDWQQAAQDWVEYDFLRDYAPEPGGPTSMSGWISPEGLFFPCGYASHAFYGRFLAVKYYDSLRGSLTLERKGWVHLMNGMAITSSPYTLAQYDVLMQIYEAFQDDSKVSYTELGYLEESIQDCVEDLEIQDAHSKTWDAF